MPQERKKLMQYNIYSFSQAEITRYNDKNPDCAIDPTDIIIFQWFKDFIVDTVTRKTENKDYKGMWSVEIDGIVYFNIRYEAIIDAFPILKFQSLKTIQRRFDKYVNGKILLKKTISHGKKGLFTYFSLTELFKSFYSDSSKPEQKINPHKEDNTFASDKNDQSKEVASDKIVQSKTVASDRNVLCKNAALDRNVQSLIYNPSINLNSLTTSDSSSGNAFSDTSEKTFDIAKAAEADFSKAIERLFGYNPRFNPNPYPDFISNMRKCGISEKFIAEYLEWIYEILQKKCRNSDNFPSYFFKSFTSEVYMARFSFEKQRQEKILAEKKARMIICPVCGTLHDKNDRECPNSECRLSKEMMESPKDVEHSKAIFLLKKQDKQKYLQYEGAITAAFEKYPLAVRFQDKRKAEEYQKEIYMIEQKYLNLSVC